MADKRKTVTYGDVGVDITAGAELVDRIRSATDGTHRPGVASGIGGFGAVFDLAATGFRDPLLVAATDGVGTKLRIAVETGDHSTIGIDLVAMCVNDLIAQGAEPLFFLDYFATGALDVAAAAQIIEGIAEGCRRAGAALVGGETAEMPGLYRAGDYDLAGFAVGAVERDRVLPRTDIAAGDVLFGLASSGLHSNGFSLARRIAETSGLQWSDPAPFSPEQSLGAACLTPTRIYVGACLNAIRTTGAIKALAHITGGGLVDNPPRALPDHLAAEIDLDAIEVPPIFAWLAATGPVAEREMLRTFNCGIGMVAVVDANAVDDVQRQFKTDGEETVELGRVVPRDAEPVVFRGRLSLGG